MTYGARGAAPSPTDRKQRKERLVKNYEWRPCIALIVLAALVLSGGWLGQATAPAAAVVPGANGRIAFDNNHDGDYEIYSMGPKGELGKRGQKAKKLTSNKAEDLTPSFSPDGTRIAFTSERVGNREIYVMNADGSKQTNLTKHSAQDVAPTWSPDGTSIAFVASDSAKSGQIVSMAADGSQRRHLTKGGKSTFPDWQAKP
jgi:Tol biopolymer transport system component